MTQAPTPRDEALVPPWWREPLLWLPVVMIGIAVFLFSQAWREFGVAQPGAVTPVPTATLTPEPSDPEALALLKQIESTMNHLTTLKVVEVLRDGSGNSLTTTIEFAAPDQVMLTTDTNAQSIGVQNQQWARARNETLWSTWTRREPFRFPDFSDSREAVDVQLGTETDLNGEDVRTVTYAFLGFEGRFDFVVYADAESLLIRRTTMKGPGHDMVTDFVDYAPPVIIRTPQPDQIAPTPTVTIP